MNLSRGSEKREDCKVEVLDVRFEIVVETCEVEKWGWQGVVRKVESKVVFGRYFPKV
jgi:hypothetical protein